MSVFYSLKDEARIQKVTKRMHTLEEVNNNVKLLNEMLVHYSKEESSEADRELMKVGLSCSRSQPFLLTDLSFATNYKECSKPESNGEKQKQEIAGKEITVFKAFHQRTPWVMVWVCTCK